MFVVIGELDISTIPETITPKEDILGGLVQDAELGPKISSIITCSMLKKVLMVMGEVDIGIRPSLLPPTIQVILVYHWFFIVMEMSEVEIGLRQ